VFGFSNAAGTVGQVNSNVTRNIYDVGLNHSF
jgi:hypothetical protein